MSAYKRKSGVFHDVESHDENTNLLFAQNANIGRILTQSNTNTQLVCVNKAGSDVLGDGTLLNPFVSIQKAMTSIVDAAESKPYAISVGPGSYPGFWFKPHVGIVGVESGASNVSSVINSAVQFDANAWASTVNGKAYFSFLSFANGVSMNVPNTNAQLEFLGCVMNGDCLFLSNAVNSPAAFVPQTVTFADTVLQSGNLSIQNCSFNFTHCATSGNIKSLAAAEGGRIELGILGATVLGGTSCQAVGANSACLGLFIGGAGTGSLSIDGVNTDVAATSSAIPSTIALANGATSSHLIRFTRAHAVAYSPAPWVDIPNTWAGTAPVLLTEAVDRLAAASFVANATATYLLP